MKIITLTLCLYLVSLFASQAQPFNHEITTDGRSPELLGKINKEGLSSETYPWFQKNYNAYNVDSKTISEFKKELSQYTILAFLGTWCGDSKKETPRFYKILDEAQFPLERLTTVALSRDRDTYKQSPGGEQESLNIHRVPTFIFYKDGKEINRIVESPQESLEKDILKIVKEDYTPNYAIVHRIDDIISEKGVEYLNKKRKKIATKLKNNADNYSALNTYASVLLSVHKTEEALAVLQLNILLFSEEPRVYERLAATYEALGDKQNALKYYQSALNLKSDEKIIAKINQLEN